MPWWPPTVGMFFLCRGQTYRVMCRRPRERRHRNHTSSAELRSGSFGNVALDALDEPIERAGGGIRHRCAGGDHFFPGIVLDRSSERFQLSGDDLCFLLFEDLDGGRRDIGIERSHDHESLLDAPAL